MINKYIPEAARAWLYRVLVPLGALAVFYGWLSEQEVLLWLALIAEMLGVSLAAANTSTAPSEEGEYDYLDEEDD